MRDSYVPLACQPAAVYGQDRAVHVICGIGGQEDRSPFEVLGLAEASGREAGQERCAALLFLAQRARQLGSEVARSDSVDVDPERCPLVGESAGKVGDASLGRRVGRHDDPTLIGENRGGVDDLASLSLLVEVPGGGLGEIEDGAQIDLYDGFPILLAELERRSATDDTSVVDEYVEASERAYTFLDDVGGELRVDLQQIDVHGVEAVALVLDHFSGLVYGDNIQGRNVCASFGEAKGDTLAEAARRSRYQRYLAIEAEVVEDAH